MKLLFIGAEQRERQTWGEEKAGKTLVLIEMKGVGQHLAHSTFRRGLG